MIQNFNSLKVKRIKIENVYHIADEKNVSLIVKHGLLSRNLIIKSKIKFDDISDQEIQQRRENNDMPPKLIQSKVETLYL
jgi:hypothetical protein